jgi:hypothetical protein
MIKRYNIDNPTEFESFLKAAPALASNQWPSLFLKMENPGSFVQQQIDTASQATSILESLGEDQGNRPSQGVQLSHPIAPDLESKRVLSETIDALIVKYSASKGGSPDHARYYDPAKAGFWFRLTPPRAREWAQVMVSFFYLGPQSPY